MLAYCRRDETLGDLPPLNVVEFFKENVDTFREILSKDVCLETNLHDLTTPIYVQHITAINFTQIVLNLISNAHDSLGGKKGSIALTAHDVSYHALECSCCGVDFQGDFVEVRVCDQGVGIDGSYLGRVFDPFFTTKEVGQGKGLGLSVVAGIMHNAGGYILVTSKSFEKTTFSLFFPKI